MERSDIPPSLSNPKPQGNPLILLYLLIFTPFFGVLCPNVDDVIEGFHAVHVLSFVLMIALDPKYICSPPSFVATSIFCMLKKGLKFHQVLLLNGVTTTIGALLFAFAFSIELHFLAISLLCMCAFLMKFQWCSTAISTTSSPLLVFHPYALCCSVRMWG